MTELEKQLLDAAKEALEAGSDGDWQSARKALSAAIDAAEAAQPVVQQAEHNLTDIRCECCGYLTHQREHMGCIRAAQQPASAQPVAQQADHIVDSAKMVQAEPVADWKNFNDGYKAGAEEMRDGLLQLCKDFSDRQNRPYMGDVLAQANSLCDLVLSEIPRSLEQQAEHNLTDVRCKCCGYITHQREHMGCIRAAHLPAVAVPEPGTTEYGSWINTAQQEASQNFSLVTEKFRWLCAFEQALRSQLSAAKKPEGV